MKYVVACLTLVAMISVLGCQENTVTSPITSAEPAGLSSAGKLAEDVIFLNDEVHLKNNVESVEGIWMLGGQVSYAVIPIATGFRVDIILGGMIKPKHVIGYTTAVAGQSTETVAGIGSQPIIIEREYLFDCGNGEKILHINFAVSETFVSVDEMWVVIPIGFGAVSAN